MVTQSKKKIIGGAVVLSLILLTALVPLASAQETAFGEVGVGNVSPVITNFSIKEVGISTVETEFTIRCEIVDNNGHDDIVGATYEVWNLISSRTIHGDLVYDGSDKYHAPPFTLDAGDSGTWKVQVEAVDDNGAEDSVVYSFGYRTDGGTPFIPFPSLRKFSSIFMSGAEEPVPTPAFEPKTTFAFDETVYFKVFLQNAANGSPVTNADVICWYNSPITHRTEILPTVELGEGYYSSAVEASELGLGVWQVGFDAQLNGFQKTSDTLTFTIVEELAPPLWGQPWVWLVVSLGLVSALWLLPRFTGWFR